MWIGQTYFFTWLDHTLNKEGNVWMVHSGGFYVVDKQTTPQLLPKTLHWFKWEAMLTWLSGIVLAGCIYGFTRLFTGRAAYMQTGAMLGTLMAWNVWARILPAQRQLIGAVREGHAPN